MGLLTNLRSRLRRQPPDPERVLARAQAEAHRRAVRDSTLRRESGGPGSGWGGGGGDGGA